MTRLIELGHGTHVGTKRSRNEDAYGVYWEQARVSESGRGPLFVVADGMGGHRAGDEASRIAVDQTWLYYEFPDERFEWIRTLENLVCLANENILNAGRENPAMHRMGCTLSALAMNQELSEGVIAHVGDSRVYRFRPSSGLEQMTKDHVRPEDPRILSRRLGRSEKIEVDLLEVHLEVGERWLLCSDGLTCDTTDEELLQVLQDVESPSEATQILVGLANRKGKDNVTVILVDIREK